MNKKKIVIATASAVAVLTLALLLIIFLPKCGSLEKIIDKPISMSEAEAYVYEISEADVSDDFSEAFLEGSSMTVTEIDGDVATVELSYPDVEKIMRELLPEDTSGDYGELFESYYEAVLDRISDPHRSDIISEEIEAPIVEGDEGDMISLEGTDILNFEAIILEMLEELAKGER